MMASEKNSQMSLRPQPAVSRSNGGKLRIIKNDANKVIPEMITRSVKMIRFIVVWV